MRTANKVVVTFVVAFAVLFDAAPARAQRLLDPQRSFSDKAAVQEFERDFASGKSGLKCSVRNYPPKLTFSFSRLTGFVTRVPLSQLDRQGSLLTLRFRVKPEGDGPPVYFQSVYRFPNLPETKKLAWQTSSIFQVGEGSYRVDEVLKDQRGRLCRSHWHVRNKLKESERKVIAAKPGQVLPWYAMRLPPPREFNRRPYRIAILVHAAPLSPVRSTLLNNDSFVLLSVLAGLFENPAFAPQSLTAFNIQEQRVLYRTTHVTESSLQEIFDSMQTLELARVDLRNLQNREGPADLLERLVAGETHSEDPPDAIVFFGPFTYSEAEFPKEETDALREDVPIPVFDLMPGGARYSRSPDAVAHFTRLLGGKVLGFYDPKGLVTAMETIANTLRGAHGNDTR